MGVVRMFLESLVITILLLLILAYSPLFLECDPQSYSVTLPKSFDGPLTINDQLNQAERILEGKIKWPESLAIHEGSLYTGINNGHIVKITGKEMQPVLRTGKQHCAGQWEESECGRPLGLRFKGNLLYVADANLGILTVDVKDGKSKALLPSTTVVDGFNLTFLNDLVFGDDGILYFTQSSTKWTLKYVVLATMDHDSTGRLLSYDLKTNEIKVLLKGLTFPNGLELSHDGTKLLIAQCSHLDIIQYHLKGPKSGMSEIFLQGLPGEPDNIRRSPSGGYWVALNTARNQSNSSLLDKLSGYPIIRKVFIRLIHLIGSALNMVSTLVPNPVLKGIAFDIETGRFLIDLLPAHGMILKFNDDGKIVQSLHSPDGKIAHLSEVLEYNGHLYLGSWRNRFLAKLKLPND